MENIRNVLWEEFQDEMQQLRGMEVGTPAYKATVDGVKEFADRLIEIDKIKAEAAERERIREIEAEQKQKQLEKELKDRVIGHWITIASIAVPAVITVWGTLVSLDFEREGTVTTIMGRGFINKLLPKK